MLLCPEDGWKTGHVLYVCVCVCIPVLQISACMPACWPQCCYFHDAQKARYPVSQISVCFFHSVSLQGIIFDFVFMFFFLGRLAVVYFFVQCQSCTCEVHTFINSVSCKQLCTVRSMDWSAVLVVVFFCTVDCCMFLSTVLVVYLHTVDCCMFWSSVWVACFCAF